MKARLKRTGRGKSQRGPGDREDARARPHETQEHADPGLIRFDGKTWTALALLLLLLVLGTAFKLHGSSVSMWNLQFKDRSPSAGVLFGTPKNIRADEWAFLTPAIVSQANSNPSFPTDNPRWGPARVPLIMNLPARHWSMLVRPQFWGFFTLDLERAFAFYWNMKATLLLGGFFLLLMLLTRNDFLASLLGTIWVFFSGFMQWWYSTPAMLPEMVGTFALLLVAIHYLALSRRPWVLGVSAAAFALFSLDFALSIYPAFQVPLFYLGIAILVGSLGPRLKQGAPLLSLRAACAVLALAVVGALLLAYYRDAKGAIDLMRGTVYPGARESRGGGLSLAQVFGGFLGFFMSEKSFPKGWANVCEASNFLLFFPAPMAALLWWKARGQRVSPLEWSLIAYILVVVTWMVVGWPQVLARLSGFKFSIPVRTLHGSGLASILLCCVFLARSRFRLHDGWRARVLVAAAAFASLAIFSFYFNRVTSGFATLVQIALVVLIGGASTYFLLVRQPLPFAACILLPSMWSFGLVNPVAVGLGPILGTELFQDVAAIARQDPGSRWAVYGGYVYADFMKTAGAQVFNGTKFVPPLDDLRAIDPASSAASIYNRYAHIALEAAEGPDVSFTLYYGDNYAMRVDPRTDLLPRLGIRYVATPSAVSDASFVSRTTLVRVIPEAGFWVYRYR